MNVTATQTVYEAEKKGRGLSSQTYLLAVPLISQDVLHLVAISCIYRRPKHGVSADKQQGLR